MSGSAEFTIAGTPFSDGGYDANEDTPVTLQVALPGVDIWKVQFSVAQRSRHAPAGAFTPSSGRPATPGGTVAFNPGASLLGGAPYAFRLRCVVNDGRDRLGNIVDEYTCDRVIVVRNAFGLRASLQGELYEYDPDFGVASLYDDFAGAMVPTAEAYSDGPVVVAGNRHITYAGPADAFLTRAASGHKPGGRVVYEFPAGSTSSLRVSPDLNIKNCAFDSSNNRVTDWNAAVPNLIALEQGPTSTAGTVIQCVVHDTAPPTVVSASADSSNPNAVKVVFSKPMGVRQLTGLSLSGAGAPTLTAIEAGDGTSTVTFTTSANITSSDVLSFVVGSSRVAADYSGNLLATGSTPIKFGLVSKAAWTRCWEAGVAMLPASGLPANFTSWTDQVGGSLQFTPAAAGHAQRTTDPGIKFSDDVTQRLRCATSPITGTDFAVFLRFKFTVVGVQDWIPFSLDTNGVSSKWVRVTATDSGTNTTVELSVYDGTTEHTKSDTYLSDTAYHCVFLWRTGGKVYMQIDNRLPVSVDDALVLTALNNITLGCLMYNNASVATAFNAGNGSISDFAFKEGEAFIGTEIADVLAYPSVR